MIAKRQASLAPVWFGDFPDAHAIRKRSFKTFGSVSASGP